LSDLSRFDERPVVVAVAGPNGAGKTTFFHAHLRPAALRFVNADVIASELDLEPYAAAAVADALRRELVKRGESFVFETVFSDPRGDKLALLRDAESAGYQVLLCYIHVTDPRVSEERVAMRVSQGGHDVPSDKLRSRFPRILANLATAIRELPNVRIYDNSDLGEPFRLVAVFERGRPIHPSGPLPTWLRRLLHGTAGR
jgi:predicted ABC-type ATPase